VTLADIDTSRMSPYRQAEVEMAKAACAVLTAFHEGHLGEIQDPDTLREFENLEFRLDEWSDVQPR